MTPGFEEAVRQIVEARKTLSVLEDLSGATQVTTLEDAYRIQRAVTERWDDKIAGWKVGATAKQVQIGPHDQSASLEREVTNLSGTCPNFVPRDFHVVRRRPPSNANVPAYATIELYSSTPSWSVSFAGSDGFARFSLAMMKNIRPSGP